jgi:hypothetical protein
VNTAKDACHFAKLPLELRLMVFAHVPDRDLYACSLVGGAAFREVALSDDFVTRLHPGLRCTLHRNTVLAARSVHWTKKEPCILKRKDDTFESPLFYSNYHIVEYDAHGTLAITNLLHPEREPVLLSGRPHDADDPLFKPIGDVVGERYLLLDMPQQRALAPSRPSGHHFFDLFDHRHEGPMALRYEPRMSLRGMAATSELSLAFVMHDRRHLAVRTTHGDQVFKHTDKIDICTPELTADGRYVLACAQSQIQIWSRADPEAPPWSPKLPDSHNRVDQMRMDRSGNYLFALLKPTPPTKTTPGYEPTAPSSCLAAWGLDDLTNGKPLATTCITGRISDCTLFRSNIETMAPRDPRLLVGFHLHDGADTEERSTGVWAPGIAPTPFFLPPGPRGQEQFLYPGYGRGCDAFFSMERQIPHRFTTVSQQTIGPTNPSHVQVWTLGAEGVSRQGPAVRLRIKGERIEMERPDEFLTFDTEGVAFWKVQSKYTRLGLHSFYFRPRVTLCRLNAAHTKWTDVRTYKEAILSPNARLLLQGGRRGKRTVYDVSQPLAT